MTASPLVATAPTQPVKASYLPMRTQRAHAWTETDLIAWFSNAKGCEDCLPIGVVLLFVACYGAIVSEAMGLSVDAPSRITLYVPHPESRLCTELAHGSAIVGLPLANGAIRIYYEGNVIGASNLEKYRARASQAAGRMLHNFPSGYPTRAREDVDPRELVEVGTIESLTGRMEITATANELSWWISPADLADLGFGREGSLT